MSDARIVDLARTIEDNRCNPMDPPIRLTPSDIRRGRADAANVLGVGSVSELTVLERRPPYVPADLLSLRKWTSVHLIEREPYMNNAVEGSLAYHRQVGIAQRRNDGEMLVEQCNEALWQTATDASWTRLIGFMAAIRLGDGRSEFLFRRALQELSFRKEDLPHIMHVVDEFMAMSSEDGKAACAVLARLNMFDPESMGKLIREKGINLPPLAVNGTNGPLKRIDKLPDLPAIPKLVIADEGSGDLSDVIKPHSRDKTARPGRLKMFSMRAKERHDKMNQESNSMYDLMKAGKWSQALAVSCEGAPPYEWDLYIKRAVCLVNMDRYTEAIRECTRSLELKRTDTALHMRASVWLMLGELEMAEEDGSAMSDRRLSGGILRDMAKEVGKGENVEARLAEFVVQRKSGKLLRQ